VVFVFCFLFFLRVVFETLCAMGITVLLAQFLANIAVVDKEAPHHIHNIMHKVNVPVQGI